MTSRRETGFALLIVLWAVVFLAFLMTEIMASGRVALGLAGNLRAAAAARAATDGAIEAAIFHLLAPGPPHWRADGAAHQLSVGVLPVTVRVETLTGMVNPNLASASLLAALLRAVGAPPEQGADLAAAIVAWRSPPDSPAAGAAALAAYRRAGAPYGPPAHPFATLGELIYVLGMTPELLARLTPHLSLYQSGDPVPAAADPVVRKALAIASASDANGGGYEGPQVVAVTACAPPPASLCRRAVVSLPGGNAAAPFRLLALTTVE